MNSEAEMRQVLLHAAEKLNAAKDAKTFCPGNHHGETSYWSPRDALMAMNYAEGVLRLLASYLKVDAPSTNGHQSEAPRVPAGTGGSNDAAAPASYHPVGEKTERNAAVVAAIKAGEPRKAVAERFGISERRVGQLVEAAAKVATP